MTDFLHDATAPFKTPFNLLSTESGFGGLANGGVVLSSIGGAGNNGVFSQTDFGSAQYCYYVFVAGGAFTPTANGNIALWFVNSRNAGSSFEKTVSGVTIPRPPDILIPLYASAYAVNDEAWSQVYQAPWFTSKFLLQNNSGVALPASGNLLIAVPVADKFV